MHLFIKILNIVQFIHFLNTVYKITAVVILLF